MSKKIKVYRTYRFRDKDPVIDKMRTIMQDEGMHVSQMRTLSGLASATIDGWFYGDTVSPQSKTIGAFVSSLGYDYGFVKVKKLDMDKELEKVANWLLKNKSKSNGRRR